MGVPVLGCKGWRGGSGVAGRPPMDSHSLAEPTADGGERESVVSRAVCVCVCVCVCLCVEGWGAN